MPIFVLLSGLLMGAGIACSSDDNGGDAGLRDAPIESAQIVSIDTFPPQYAVSLVAQIPGSTCYSPEEPTVVRDDTTFRVSVQNYFHGNDACSDDLGRRNVEVLLPGPFDSGVLYTVEVNTSERLTFTAE